MANTFETTIDLTDAAIASNAGFQAWVQAIENAILASGFFEVAPDTGQINPLTVAAPTVSATDAGYRVYRAKDALAATRPVYLKLIFGTAAQVGRVRLTRVIGTSSNGAGTLGGITVASSIVTSTSTGSSSVRILGGGGPSMGGVQTVDGSLNQNMFLGVGRMVDPTLGTSVDQITFLLAAGTSTFTTSGCLYTDHSIAWAAWDPVGSFPNLLATPHNGGSAAKIRAFKGYIYRGGEVYDFPFLIARNSEFPLLAGSADNSKFTADAWGAPRTWMPNGGVPAVSATGSALIMRWE